jgi:hypothetical protein
VKFSAGSSVLGPGWGQRESGSKILDERTAEFAPVSSTICLSSDHFLEIQGFSPRYRFS